jgi:indole-3-glycerol phosphate synthase
MPASNRLLKIIEHKRQEIEPLLAHTAELREKALERNDFRSFKQALDLGENALALIAEVKKASPSAGIISEDFDHLRIAQDYEECGAMAISVLTDEEFFKGHLDYLTRIRRCTSIPLLRKDFILEPAQVYQSVCAGADAILLIVAALEQSRLRRLLDVAYGCQLDVLVEVHDQEELDRALATEAEIIGINNRDLRTFTTDLATTERLAEEVPRGTLLISESGIFTGDDSRRVFEAGANAILVGEALMKSNELREHIAELLAVGIPATETDLEM